MRAFLILLLAASSGCVTRIETTEPPRPVFPAGSENPAGSEAQHQSAQDKQNAQDKRVVIDASLDHAIHIVRITSKVSPEGYLKIQLNVQNMTDKPRHFRYRIDWYDQDGLGLPLAGTTVMDWMLLSRETSFLAATAPTPAARDFRVIFAAN
jgi:uncharacterized protein YcfL